MCPVNSVAQMPNGCFILRTPIKQVFWLFTQILRDQFLVVDDICRLKISILGSIIPCRVRTLILLIFIGRHHEHSLLLYRAVC